MPRRTPALAAIVTAAALGAGLVPAAAFAGPGGTKPVDPGMSERGGSSSPVIKGRPDGVGDGRKNG